MAAAASDITVYWGSGSVYCWRVMIALEEKGLSKYNSVQLAFSKKEHKGPDVLKLNPRGQLPTCKFGENIVNESMAACEFIESMYSSQGTKLVPDDPAKKAFVLQRKYESLNLAKKGLEDLVVPYTHKTKPLCDDQDQLKKNKAALLVELKVWEGYLEQMGADSYIAGPYFTMADVIFYPCLAFLVRMGLQLEGDFPKLAAYYKQTSDRPSIKASWPPHWKESPGKDFIKNL